MKNMYTPQRWSFVFCFLFSLFTFNVFAQVGIGTTNPNPNALLDLDASTTPGGLLLPRVALSGTTSFAPMTANVEGMVVYNTATTTAGPNQVTPGYYYNDGSQWVRVAADSAPSNDWTTTGNSGLNINNNFIGTTDGVNLRFKTSNADAFEISSGNATNRGKLRAMTNGTEALPIYSWSSDTDTGMYRIGANTFGFSTNALERFRLNANEAVFNDTSNDYDFRIESDGQENLFVVDASTNRIGIQTATPSYNFHMLNSGNIGASAMALFANTGTDGVALSARNSGVNGYNVIEGITDFNTTGFTPAGVYGLGIATSGTSIGVRGIANSSNGYGVFGSIPTTGTWQGYGGVFLGGLGYANGVYNLSDERAKKNITKISSALDNIMMIEGVSYNYDMKKFNPNASEDPHTYYGFLAQNIKEYLPFAVAEKNVPFDDSVKVINSSSTEHTQLLNVVDYTAIVPVIVEAMKEQQAQIKSLQEEIKALREKK